MSDAKVIAYPQSFLARPEDRLLLSALSGLQVQPDTARLLLYRIWADFATGGSDRRLMAEAANPCEPDRQWSLIEDFVNWQGGKNALVAAAIDAGFLTVDVTGASRFLVCKDFFPINSAWSSSGKSFQKKGAYSRAVNKQRQAAETNARSQMAIWDATKPADIATMGQAEREAALIFIHRIGRALSIKVPADSELRAGPLQRANTILQETGVKPVDDTLLWLLSQAKDPAIPRTIPDALEQWSSLVERAEREVM